MLRYNLFKNTKLEEIFSFLEETNLFIKVLLNIIKNIILKNFFKS